MTLNIKIPREAENRLRSEAARLGIDEAQYAATLIVRGLPNWPEALDEDVESFVRDHSLTTYVDAARQLIAEHFHLPVVQIQMKDDPEFADAWLSLSITANGDVGSVLSAYNAFTQRFAAIIPAELSSKIRLSIGMA